VPEKAAYPGGMSDEHQQLERVKAKLRGLERPAWRPMMQPGEGAITASKTSGRAWLKPDETWPLCPNCQSPLRLVLQLNLQDLPGELQDSFGTGLLQLFCCESDFQIRTGTFTSTPRGSSVSIEISAYWDEAGELIRESSSLPEEIEEPRVEEIMRSCHLCACTPFSSSQVARIVQPQGLPANCPMPIMETFFPEKLVTGWEHFSEYPTPEEASACGVALDRDETAVLHEAGLWPKTGDKLGGWPCWAQALDYPSCPTCKQPMNRLLFQLEQQGRENFPYPHQGLGVGYLVQCSAHPEQVTFFCQFT
jgi:hypothetical protein